MITELLSSDLTDIIKDSILYKFNLKSESELKEVSCIFEMLDLISSPFKHVNTEYKRIKSRKPRSITYSFFPQTRCTSG